MQALLLLCLSGTRSEISRLGTALKLGLNFAHPVTVKFFLACLHAQCNDYEFCIPYKEAAAHRKLEMHNN